MTGPSRGTPPTLVAATLVGATLAALAYLASNALHGGEWRALQRRYNTLQRATRRPLISLGIRALTPASGSEQRCVSCHLGMALPAGHRRQVPFQPHPPTSCTLPLATIGCVACHRGHGLALTVRGAHGLTAGEDPWRVLDWRGASGRRPTSPRTAHQRRALGRRLQAGCAPCHVDRRGGRLRYDPRAVPDVVRGQRLFVEQGCFSCHRVTGVYVASERGPRLDTVGVTRSAAAIVARLERPQRANPRSAMPPTSLEPQQLERLVLFLVARVGLEREPASSPRAALVAHHRPARLLDTVDDRAPVPPTANEAAGAQWATAGGCRGCHRLDGAGSGVPDLRRVGWYGRADELKRLLERPREVLANTMMPALPLPETVRDSIVVFLLKQRTPLPSAPAEVLEQVCGACHGATGHAPDPKVVVLARRPPRLSRAGVGRPAFVRAVTEGRPGTAMPPWGRVLGRSLIDRLHEGLPATGSAPGAPRTAPGRREPRR